MLTQYQTRTNQLLIYPVPSVPLYATSDVTGWINEARGQLAGESECIRVLGTISLTEGTISYPFTSISLGGASGVSGVVNVRQMWYSVASGKARVTSRPWEWFSLYNLNNPVPNPGPPQTWAQFGQGASAQSSPNPINGGSLYVDPPPDTSYTAYVDCVCFPAALASDSDPEAIPYLWTNWSRISRPISRCCRPSPVRATRRRRGCSNSISSSFPALGRWPRRRSCQATMRGSRTSPAPICLGRRRGRLAVRSDEHAFRLPQARPPVSS